VNRPGAFAEYLCIPITNVWHADPRISMDLLSIFDPSAMHPYHSAISSLGGGCADYGRWPHWNHGHRDCQTRRSTLCRYDRYESYRLDLAKKMGATVALNVKEKTLAQVQKELGMKEGFDVVSRCRGAEKHSKICSPTYATEPK